MKQTTFKNAKALNKAIKGKILKFILEVSLSDLYSAGGIDGLNELVDRFIDDIPWVTGGTLVEISYRVVGCKRATLSDQGSVFLEVLGSTEELEFEN